jgi:hypothetical protein
MQTHLDALKVIMTGTEEYDEMMTELNNADHIDEDDCGVEEMKPQWNMLLSTPVVIAHASNYLVRTNDFRIAKHIEAIHDVLIAMKTRINIS